MLAVHPQYITDDKGEKLAIVLPMNEFKSIMEDLEELEDIRLYDEAKLSNEPLIPMDEAFKIIEANRKLKS